jgi:hypothetical protein
MRVSTRSSDFASRNCFSAASTIAALLATPPVPESSRAGAELVGRKRFEHFTREVGARLAGKARYSDTLLAAIDLVRPSADENDNEERAA